jgi:hypothetical protein
MNVRAHLLPSSSSDPLSVRVYAAGGSWVSQAFRLLRFRIPPSPRRSADLLIFGSLVPFAAIC